MYWMLQVHLLNKGQRQCTAYQVLSRCVTYTLQEPFEKEKRKTTRAADTGTTRGS